MGWIRGKNYEDNIEKNIMNAFKLVNKDLQATLAGDKDNKEKAFLNRVVKFLDYHVTMNDPRVILVNIFAGINRCDWVAEGIVQALQKIEVKVPLVIRLAGTNVEKGNEILKKSKIKYIEANTLEDAANKAVKALGK